MNGARLLLLLGLAALSPAAVPSPAAASTIFFIRADNIWAANPDGSGQRALTTDGTDASPYLRVASAKAGSAPPLAFMRYVSGGDPAFVYGTIAPDGSGSAADPASANYPMAGFAQGDNHDLSVDVAGDRIAWTRATNIGYGETSSPDVVGVDGSAPLEVSRGTTTLSTTFGDSAGQSLLFDDRIPDDYSDYENSLKGWSPVPAVCMQGSSTYAIVRQLPVAYAATLAAPIAYYCTASLDLTFPALRPDGQVIAAVASGDPPGPGPIVTIPIGGAASSSTGSPLTYVTPQGTQGQHPDFSPDGTSIAFEDVQSGGIDTLPAVGGTPSAVVANGVSPAWSPYTAPGGGTGTGGGTGAGGGTGTGGGAGTGGGGTAGGGAGSAPAILSARVANRRVRAGRGIALVVRLARAGTVRVVVSRLVRGRYRRLGTLTFRVSGGGSRHLTIARAAGRRLAPGSYRLRVYAVSGHATGPRALTLKVTVTRR